MNETCDDTQELLPWLVNDTLTSAETVAVLDHVRTCPVCRRDLAFLVATKSAVQVAWGAQPERAAADGLWAQIESELPEQERSLDRHRSWISVTVGMIVRGMSPLSFVYDAFSLACRVLSGNVRELLAVIR